LGGEISLTMTQLRPLKYCCASPFLIWRPPRSSPSKRIATSSRLEEGWPEKDVWATKSGRKTSDYFLAAYLVTKAASVAEELIERWRYHEW